MSPLFSLSADEQQNFFVTRVPHNEVLGFRLSRCSTSGLSFDMPYAAALVGNPATGEMHQGALTALLDATAGSSVLIEHDVVHRSATLDLRVDFLRPSRAGQDIRCDARCLSLSDHVATVRAVAYERDGSAEDPIAVATGSFALFAQAPKAAADAGASA